MFKSATTKRRESVKADIEIRLAQPGIGDQARELLGRLGDNLSWLRRTGTLEGHEGAVMDSILLAFQNAEAQVIAPPDISARTAKGAEALRKYFLENSIINGPRLLTVKAQEMRNAAVNLREDQSWIAGEWQKAGLGGGPELICTFLDWAAALYDLKGAEQWKAFEAAGLETGYITSEKSRKNLFEHNLSTLLARDFRRPYDELVASLSDIAYPTADVTASPEAIKQRRQRARSKRRPR